MVKLTVSKFEDWLQTVGSDPCFILKVTANPAYCPMFRKQSEVKWLAQTYSILEVVVGTCPSKIKFVHRVFSSSVVGRVKRLLCWFVQPTTEQVACLARTFDIFEKGVWQKKLSL